MVHGQCLKSNADFDNAILLGLPVSVTQAGQHLGIGHVTSYTYYVVKMENGYFFKDTCIFTVCSPVLKNWNT
jgi:hypothetical protein